jgi:hypothetical protein
MARRRSRYRGQLRGFELLRRQGLLQPVSSPHHADLIAAASLSIAHGPGPVERIRQAYNTRLVKQADLPANTATSRSTLKGKPASRLPTGVCRNRENPGKRTSLFRELAAKNGLSVRRTRLLAQMAAPAKFRSRQCNFTAEQKRRRRRVSRRRSAAMGRR